jgi:hypothetical protein
MEAVCSKFASGEEVLPQPDLQLQFTLGLGATKSLNRTRRDLSIRIKPSELSLTGIRTLATSTKLSRVAMYPRDADSLLPAHYDHSRSCLDCRYPKRFFLIRSWSKSPKKDDGSIATQTALQPSGQIAVDHGVYPDFIDRNLIYE